MSTRLVTLSWVSLISSALEVPLGVMALAVVFTLQNWQVAKHRNITELISAAPAVAAFE